MNVVKPLIIEKMTSDAYGSIEGRGVTMAANKLKKASGTILIVIFYKATAVIFIHPLTMMFARRLFGGWSNAQRHSR